MEKSTTGVPTNPEIATAYEAVKVASARYAAKLSMRRQMLDARSDYFLLLPSGPVARCLRAEWIEPIYCFECADAGNHGVWLEAKSVTHDDDGYLIGSVLECPVGHLQYIEEEV